MTDSVLYGFENRQLWDYVQLSSYVIVLTAIAIAVSNSVYHNVIGS